MLLAARPRFLAAVGRISVPSVSRRALISSSPAIRNPVANSSPSRLGLVSGYTSVGRHLNKRCMTTSPIVSPVPNTKLSGMIKEVAFLDAVNDDHGGVIVEMKEQMDSDSFVTSLQASMANWRKQGIEGVWMKLPIELSNLVEPAVKEGFRYHHAEPNYLMLVYWIPDTKNTLPVNATHRVGVGAFVMNDSREILVVQEKSGVLRGTGVWKFPTGVIEQGEDIYAGAIREVKEETGVNTEFVEILAFRQSHMSFFEKSDLFFVCMLRPLSFEIQPQQSEIEAAKWMHIEEYAAQPFVQKHDLLKYVTSVCFSKIDNTYAGLSPVRIKSAFSEKWDNLYLNKKDLNRL